MACGTLLFPHDMGVVFLIILLTNPMSVSGGQYIYNSLIIQSPEAWMHENRVGVN